MRKNRKHEAKKPRLAKRALALCFALIFVCSCLLPAFAHDGAATFEAPAEGGIAMMDVSEDNYGVDTQTETADTSTDTATTQPGGMGGGIVVGDGDTTDSTSGGMVRVDDPDGNIVYVNPNVTESDEVLTPSDDPNDSVIISRPEGEHALDKVDAGFSLPTNIYHFWLKEMSSYDLADISTEAASRDMTVEQYLAMYGKDTGCYHIMTAADGADLNDYKFANPTFLDDSEGRNFAGWYTIDEFGEKHDFTFDQTLFISTGTTVEVFAKWEAPVDLSADAKIDYDNGVYLSVNIEQMTGGAKSLNVKALDDDEMESFYNAYLNSLSNENDALMPLVGLDITPEDDLGKKVQPSKAVTVEISNLKEIGLEDGESLKVLHRTEDGVETLNATYNNGTLKFKTKSFSEFVVAGAAMPDTDDGNANDGISTLSIYAPDDDLMASGYNTINTMTLVSDHGGRSDRSKADKMGLTFKSDSERFEVGKCSWTIPSESAGLISFVKGTDTTGQNPGWYNSKSTIYSESVTIQAAKSNDIDWGSDTVKTATIYHTFSYKKGTATITQREVRTIRILKNSFADAGQWIYLYVEVDGTAQQMEALGLDANVNNWLTVGKIKVDGVTNPSNDYTSSYINGNTWWNNWRVTNPWTQVMTNTSGTWKLQNPNEVERFEKNQKIDLNEVDWNAHGLKCAVGAAEYIGSSDQLPNSVGLTWHLDGKIALTNYWGSLIVHHKAKLPDGTEIEFATDSDLFLRNTEVDVKTYKKDTTTIDGVEYELVSDDDIVSDNFEPGTKTIKIVGNQKREATIYYRPVTKTANVVIQKHVTGLFGEREKEFSFTVKDMTFSLKNGEESSKYSDKTIEVKVGDELVIQETNAGGYTTTASVVKGDDNANLIVSGNKDDELKTITVQITEDMISDGVIHIDVTNDKDGPVDNGVLLDTLPYLIILGIAAAGAVALLIRKKKHDDE